MKREDVKVGQRVQITAEEWAHVNSPIFTESTLSLSREGVVASVDYTRFGPMKVVIRHDVGQDFGDGRGLVLEWPWFVSHVELVGGA